ncbi:mitochondrial thiamine pyrophosphate transporter [Lodderomyces elongisporus]|uniref:mitochondrial thiamine pyrophosphate transporter n=1 Tax=Lodderomyces elongisporus TaxID=36914 RepID=UPI00291CEDFA|nr:mitochondrial thiamine pyrophosphate transporter [Lodderomyces elongisporus]WLF78169.1 mitochondrial thiamine pyrophosphate transporter [Lodderomyces elongisporus]
MSSKHREDHLKRGSDVSPYESLFAGSVSGGVARAITAPLDTIKIRLQLQTKSHKHPHTQKVSALNVVKDLLKNEGVIALWKGNVPAEILYVMYGAVQFTTYSALSKSLSQMEKDYSIVMPSSVHSLLAGVGAGIASTLTTYPFDLLRTRLVANKKKNLLSMTGTFRKILHAEGISGLFAGIRPAMISVASTTGLMFWSYELAREFSSEYKHVPFIEGICGFVAGATSKGITFPLDTLRKRCQIYSEVYGTKYKSSLRIFMNIVSREGVLGLYRGYGVSILKTAPTSAISLWTYEYVISATRHYRSSKPLV